MDAKQMTRRRTRQRRPDAAGNVSHSAPREKKESPAVVYTQPDPFNKKRFILRLATVLAVVLAVIFGMSIFFKVDEEKITVSGANKYTAWDVREASGIVHGENLLTLSDAAISNRILKKLPYIESVRIGIELPDTVRIEVVERKVVYAIEAEDESWWLISADGLVVDQKTAAEAAEYTRIYGIQITAPQIASQAVAVEPEPEVSETGETIPVTIYGRERLDAVISILENLEKVGIIGDAASVDVSNMLNLELWIGDQYQVTLGDAEDIPKKIQYMKDVMDKLGEEQEPGLIDVSFTIYPDGGFFSDFDDHN